MPKVGQRKCRADIKNAGDECQLWSGHDGEHVGINVAESEWCAEHRREIKRCEHAAA